MKRDYIAEAKALEPWYHTIAISEDYTTTTRLGAETFKQWENNRAVRSALDYTGKTVLDLGTMDGMWAFEAERLGALKVVATDIWQGFGLETGPQRFDVAHAALKSKVVLKPGGDVHNLHSWLLRNRLFAFDIVQCLGLLYHIQNPILALHQIRKCTNDGGVMLLETAYWNENSDGPAMRYNSDGGIYCDPCTFWAMNPRCLVDVLQLCGFKARSGALMLGEGKIRRVSVVCDTLPVTKNADNFGT